MIPLTLLLLLALPGTALAHDQPENSQSTPRMYAILLMHVAT